MAVSLRDLQQRGNGRGRQPRTQKAKTYQFRQWKTLNLTDAQLAEGCGILEEVLLAHGK